MIGTLIFGTLIAAFVGMGILAVGVYNDRGGTKMMAALAVFCAAVSFLTALSADSFDAALFWLPMTATGAGVAATLMHKLWVEREVKWWKGIPWWKDPNRVK